MKQINPHLNILLHLFVVLAARSNRRQIVLEGFHHHKGFQFQNHDQHQGPRSNSAASGVSRHGTILLADLCEKEVSF